jgi:small subunit ribosomal protein S1
MAETDTTGSSKTESGEPSFEQMLEESLARSRVTLEKGDRVRGRVLSMGRREAVIDLGAKREAILNLSELSSEGEPLRLNVNDEIEGTIVDEGSEGEPARITAQVPGGRLGRQVLSEVKRENRTVIGVVRGYNRGGLEVQIGALRAFCPMSQIEARPVEDLSQFVGQRLSFKVHDLRGRQVVVSRRAVLDEERASQAQATIARLSEGSVVTGTVTTLHDFGAFIDVGGLDALLPTSEVTRRRINHPSEVLKPGQQVEIQIIKVEPGEGKRRARITASMKSMEGDPWEAAREWLKEGAAFRGRVVGVQPFGAFVELVPGVDGLIHISDLAGGRRVESPEELVSVGEELDVLVGAVDWENRRVSLTPLAPLENRPPPSTSSAENELRTTLGDALREKGARQG